MKGVRDLSAQSCSLHYPFCGTSLSGGGEIRGQRAQQGC